MNPPSTNKKGADGSRNPAIQDFLAFEDSDSDDCGIVFQQKAEEPVQSKTLPVNNDDDNNGIDLQVKIQSPAKKNIIRLSP